MLLLAFFAFPAHAENWTYNVQLADFPEYVLPHFEIRREPSSQFRPGVMERNLSNQANLNFLNSGGGCRVFCSTTKLADTTENCQVDLQVSESGLSTRIRYQGGITRVDLTCLWPGTSRRSAHFEWVDPETQFLCVTELFQPEEHAGLGQLEKVFDRHFLDYPSNSVTMLVLTASLGNCQASRVE